MLIIWISLAAFSVMQVDGSYPERVRLHDVEVLTLRNGMYTNARRSSPIPQLKCVGGNAGCSAYTPQVVQCYNRGSDGYDVQWECKSDMDKAYRFGEIEVSCEGYDYPDDPYILKGSCGLEYKLDLTGAGNQKYDYHSQSKDSYRKSSYQGSSIGTYILLAFLCFVAYQGYKWYTAQQQQPTGPYPSDPPPPYSGFSSSAPPPPGFRPEYMPGNNAPGGGCSNSSTYSGANTHSSSFGGMGTGMGGTGMGTGGGGFWSGAATGGILGYLFGSRNNAGYNTGYGYQQPYYRSSPSWGSSGFGSGSGGSWFQSGSSSSNSGSSGTRTTSGFGGTKRR